MNTYKEIFVDFASNSEVKAEEINFTKGSEFTMRHSIDPTQTRQKGINLSLPNYLIFGNIENNTITLTITKTIQTKTTPEPTPTPFLIKYKLIFTDTIIENVTAIPISERNFILTIFTNDGQVNQIEFDSVKSYTTASGSFSRSMEIATVEYLNFFKSNYFALGSKTGIVYLIKMENCKGTLKIEILDEIKKSVFKEKLTSLINLNLNLNIFSQSKKTTYDSVKSIKHLGNNLIAYVTEEFNFKIYNYKTRREIYQNCLIKNRIDERLSNSKINFYVLNFTEEDLRQSRSKCFIFTIYLEYNFTNVLNSFEVWFANIPEIDINTFVKSDSIGIIKDFNAFYEFIDLGQDIRIKNIRVYKLSGKLVDFINYDKKIWVLNENPHYNEGSGDCTNQNDMLNYNLKVFSINKILNPLNYEGDLGNFCNVLTEEPKIVFYDLQIKNFENILNQIKSYKNYNISYLSDSDSGLIPRNNKKMNECLNLNFSDLGNIEVQLLFQLLTCGEYIDDEILISYFNSKFVNNINSQKFLNKSQIFSFLEKSCQNIQKSNLGFTGSASNKCNQKDTNLATSQFLQTIMEDLIRRNNENSMTSLGLFITQEIEGLSLIRKKGISFLKTCGKFEYVNEIINSHEYFLRNLIFNSDNINKYQSHNMTIINELQSLIMNYLTLEAKHSNENFLFIILALLRIYLTEVYLLIKDEKYLHNYFVDCSSFSEYKLNFMDAFVKEHFESNLENQFNNLNYLDVFHQVIYNTYLNNKSIIDDHIQILLKKFRKYKAKIQDVNIEVIEAENLRIANGTLNGIKKEKYNSKFIEILTKMTFAKIQAFYFISRDLLALTSWMKKFNTNFSTNTNYLENFNKKSNQNFNLLGTEDKNDIQKIFFETSSCFILASHRCKVNLKESSIIENVCFVEKGEVAPITNSQSANDIEVNFIQLTIYENLYRFGPRIFREVQNNYIDYIITNIWTNINLSDKDENETIEKRKFYILAKLFKMREYKFISLLLKIYNEESQLENLYLDIICQGYLGDMSKMKDYLNKYFSILIDMSNHIYSTGLRDFSKFKDFYSNFSNYLSKKDLSSLNKSDKIINNFVIEGFYYLEEQMKFILSDEMKYEFYFHCYSFIYPAISKLEFSIDSEEAKKIQEFLFNMLVSCVDIDIDLALSCYCIIIRNFKTLYANDEIIGIFVDYMAKSRDNISFIRKLITQEYDFINNICYNLEKRCEKLKDNSKILFLLKSTLKLETESVVLLIPVSERDMTNSSYSINSQNIIDLQRNVNYFTILFSIYSMLRDYEKAAKIYYSYSESISDVIKMNDFNLKDLRKVYSEHKSAIFNVIHCLNQMSLNSNKSNINFLHRDISGNDYSVNFITKETLVIESKLINAKIDLLNYFTKHENKLSNSGLKIEDYNKIRSTNILLNYLFRFKLYETVVHYKLLTALNDVSAKKLIINMIKTIIAKSRCVVSASKEDDGMQVDQSEEENLMNLNRNYSGRENSYDEILSKFYEQIVEGNRVEFVITAVETVMYANAGLETKLPDLLIECARKMVPLRLFELFIKYSRIQDLTDHLIYLVEKNISFPRYFIDVVVDNVKIESERNREIFKLVLQQ